MTWSLFLTFFRSFFLQTLWNFERMQNVGFAFCMEPLLSRLDVSKTVFRKMLRRQLMFFNTHPYFAPIVMGVVYSKENSRKENQDEEDVTVTVLKDSMGGAFGAVGDHVIWGTWRPFVALIALSLGVMVASPTHAWQVCAQWWIVGFLCMFNATHLWLRWRGLQKAVNDGPGVVRWVESLHLQSWAAQVRRMGLLLLVVLVLAYLGRWSSTNLLIWMVGVLLGTVVMKRWAFSGFAVFYLISAAAMTLGYLGSINMTEKIFAVKNKLGLHARPAALFVQTTNRFRCSVKVTKGDVEVDGKSIMGLMMLAAEEGSQLRIVVNGEDEKDVLQALEQLFEKRFNEKE